MPSNPTTQTKSGFTWFQEWCGNVTASPAFEHLITALIILNAILLGMETYPALRDRFDGWMMLGNRLVVAVFVIEALMKLTAVAPRFNRYFADPWNQFDFLVVVFSLIPAAGPFATIARLGRLMRVLRLISAVPELRLIVTTLVRSIPSMGNVVLLMGLIFYVYAVLGQHFFHEVDPTHWATLGTALLTLFKIVTLEGWIEIMDSALEAHPLSWLYFISFIVIGTFVVINLFIAVVINNLDEAKAERLAELTQPPGRDELLSEFQKLEEAMARVKTRLECLERK